MSVVQRNKSSILRGTLSKLCHTDIRYLNTYENLEKRKCLTNVLVVEDEQTDKDLLSKNGISSKIEFVQMYFHV